MRAPVIACGFLTFPVVCHRRAETGAPWTSFVTLNRGRNRITAYAETGAHDHQPAALKQGHHSTLNRGRVRVITCAETGADASHPLALKQGRWSASRAALKRGRHTLFERTLNQTLGNGPPLKRGRACAETGALSFNPALKRGRICAEAGAQSTLKRGHIYRTEPSLNVPEPFSLNLFLNFKTRIFSNSVWCRRGGPFQRDGLRRNAFPFTATRAFRRVGRRLVAFDRIQHGCPRTDGQRCFTRPCKRLRGAILNCGDNVVVRTDTNPRVAMGKV